MPIIWVIGTVIVTLGVVYLAFDRRRWRDRYDELDASYVEILDRAMKAEANFARSETEHTFLKQAIATQLQRPVVAVLTDEQAHGIMQAVTEIAAASTKNPNQLN